MGKVVKGIGKGLGKAMKYAAPIAEGIGGVMSFIPGMAPIGMGISGVASGLDMIFNSNKEQEQEQQEAPSMPQVVSMKAPYTEPNNEYGMQNMQGMMRYPNQTLKNSAFARRRVYH